MTPAHPEAGRGWDSTFREFGDSEPSQIVTELRKFVEGLTKDYVVTPGQERVWGDSVRGMQREFREVREVKVGSESYGVILEYELPLEFRRPDSVLLLNQSVAVVEFKGGDAPTEAGIDQTHAYARDLRAYHRECEHREVHPVLVPMRMKGERVSERGVTICGPGSLDDLILELDRDSDGPPLDRERFLSEEAYRPLPSLIAAARELFNSRRVRKLWRSIVDTDEATEAVLSIIREAKATGTRRLVLLTGVPGAGKTLVGLRVAHEPVLDEIKSPDSPIPAVFLSGNGPLVDVLQHEIKAAGGGGKTFVRAVKAYVDYHAKRPGKVPNEHVVVFDEAQRAWDVNRIRMRHSEQKSPMTEPGHLVEFADRRKDWAVIVGLIGSGQEIQVGEEGGLALWRDALEHSPRSPDWAVHGPTGLGGQFGGGVFGFRSDDRLMLAHSVRSHLSNMLHAFVDGLLELAPAERLRELSRQICASGFDFRVSRDLAKCEGYLRERYAENPAARFGKLVSGRAKGMEAHGFPNDWKSIGAVKNKIGLWYGNSEGEAISCRNLDSCATEFDSQGLELDATLLCWGPDFLLGDRGWDIGLMMRYNAANRKMVKDPLRLRTNAYRVLLTRARDACVIFVPTIKEGDRDLLRPVHDLLLACGMRPL